MEGLIKELRKEPGCLYYRFQRENKNKFSLDSDWNTREGLEAHFQSSLFSILLGAFHALCEQPEVKVTDGPKTYGMEVIEAARNK
jgi:quinol monooxygenase YgiN